MKITIVTLFPSMFSGFLRESIVARAIEKNLVTITYVNPRDFALDAHKSVDDRPYGGGPGMVLKVDVLHRALQSIEKGKTLLTSASGSLFDQQKAKKLATEQHLIFICGHYEGFDERILHHVDEEVRIGDMVLTGGELPTAVMIDSIVRLIPGVLKKEDATTLESFGEVSLAELQKALPDEPMIVELLEKGQTHVKLLEFPQYTRPAVFDGGSVPDVLTGGDPKKIRIWQLQQAWNKTKEKRPDLLLKKS